MVLFFASDSVEIEDSERWEHRRARQPSSGQAMTEWRRLGPEAGGRDPAAVLALMQPAALANRRTHERSHEIAAWCGAIVEQATRDLTAARARVEATETNAEAAETRAREAEAQVEEFELWLNRIEALLSDELAAPGLPAAHDPFDGLIGSQDGGSREFHDPGAANRARPSPERVRTGGLRAAIAALRRIVAVP